MKIQNNDLSRIGFLKPVDIMQHVGECSTGRLAMIKNQTGIDIIVTVAGKPPEPYIKHPYAIIQLITEAFILARNIRIRIRRFIIHARVMRACQTELSDS
jgi:hypothetical protein